MSLLEIAAALSDDNKTLSSNPTGYAEYEFVKEMLGKRGEKL